MNRAILTSLIFGYIPITATYPMVHNDDITEIDILLDSANTTFLKVDRKLNLSRQRLKSFPEEITKHADLIELDLSENQITEIPDKIENLRNLKILDLSSNHKLTCLPQKMKLLTKIEKLNLTRCNISPITIDETLGKIDLLKIFDDRVLFHNIYLHDLRNSEYAVFGTHMNQQIHWNWVQLNRIRTAENTPLLEMEKIFEIIKTAYHSKIYKAELLHGVKEISKKINTKSAERGYSFNLNKFTCLPESLDIIDRHGCINLIKSKSDATLLKNYIKKIYDSVGEWDEYAMFGGHVPITANLISNVFRCLYLFMNFERIGSLLYIADDIKEIIESIKRFNSKSKNNGMNADLEIFVKNRIAVIKNETFEIAIKHGISIGQLSHCDWKQKFVDVTRFDFNYDATDPLIFPPNFHEDEFTERTKAMQIFIDFFDPRYVIKILTVEINMNNEMKEKLINMIKNDTKINSSERVNMILNFTKSKVLGLFESSVSQKAVEYLLVEMKILTRRATRQIL